MRYPIEVTDSKLVHTAVIRSRVPAKDLAQFVPAACGEVWSFIRSAGLPRPGRHMALYLDDGSVEVGAEVSEPFAGNGRIHCSTLPAGRMVTTVHFGPYQHLSGAHAAIREWCAGHGHRCSGVSWEIYGHWDESWNADSSKIRTDVFYLLAAASWRRRSDKEIMKRLTLAIISVCVIGGAAVYLNRQKTVPVSPAEPIPEAVPNRTIEDRQPAKVAAVPQSDPTNSATAPNPGQPPLASPALSEIKPDNSTNSTATTAFRQAIDILVSPQTTFQQRQAAWKQLRDAGELDQALATLKQGATNNPSSAEYSTALGEAYIYKLQTVRDFHEVSILALQADQSFNTALGLDPANWEAQFFKAAALSRWPAEMNKGPEVIQQLSNLIDQQEAMPAQPQFAQTYVLLGDQYKKAGRPDYAVQTWRLGLAKFPADSTLQGRIAHP